jgi:uncharacterized protein YcbX
LVLHYGSHPPCTVDITKPPASAPFEFNFHGAPGVAVEVSEAASAWLGEVFNEDYFLVHIEGVRSSKLSKPELASRMIGEPSVSFQDIFHILVCTEESYDEMLKHLPSYKVNDVSMLNMRPNIVVRNVKKPFDEDYWEGFSIGSLKFTGVGECSRCKLVTVSPKTLEHDPNNEPSKTLQRIHGDDVKGYFGLWTQALNSGKIKVKDSLVVKMRRETSRLHRVTS